MNIMLMVNDKFDRFDSNFFDKLCSNFHNENFEKSYSRQFVFFKYFIEI